MDNEIIVDGKSKTIQRTDVAKLAGVSHMTVTRVLQNHPHVKEGTRQRVLEACKTLNYRYNILASYMRSKKSQALGIICPKLEHSFFVRLVKALELKSSEFGYHMVITQTEDDCSSKEYISKLEFLMQRQVDGLIISTQISEEIRDVLKGEDIPIITTEQMVPGLSYVGTEDLAGARMATNYLLGLGHTDIAILGGIEGFYSARQRFEGYRQALIENGFELRPDLVVPTEDYDMPGGYNAAMKLLDDGVDFTAIFAANDYVAVGALSALDDRGIKVPDDISVIGFSGDKIGEYSIPRLTTIYQPVEDLGRKLVDILLEQVQSEKREVVQKTLANHLIERRSCKRRI